MGVPTIQLKGGPCDGMELAGAGEERQILMPQSTWNHLEAGETLAERLRQYEAQGGEPPKDASDALARVGEEWAKARSEFPDTGRIAVYEQRPSEPLVYDFTGEVHG